MAEPVPSQSLVSIPLSLADRLFACYYGAGPRHHTSPASSPPIAPVPDPPPSPTPTLPAPTPPRSPILNSSLGRLIPRGMAPGALPFTPPPAETPAVVPPDKDRP